MAASALAGAACDTSPDTAGAGGWSFGEDFAGTGEGWPRPWVNVRWLTRLTRSGGTGSIELDPAPKQTFRRPHPAYMGALALVGTTESLDVTVRTRLRIEGPIEAGVVTRVTFDEGYAVLISHEEAALYRYTPVDREVLDRVSLPTPQEWTTLEMVLREGDIYAAVRSGNGDVELSARDDDPAPGPRGDAASWPPGGSSP